MNEPIVTTATVAKVQTMADGGLRFIFDAPETETLQAAQLMECKRFGVVGKLVFEQVEDTEEVRENEPEQQRSARKIHI
jgi:hypothetical protein